jgi:thymidylate synthase (FAD)
MITMRETVPIFVARQRFKHTVGFTYNEVSRRYVDDEPEFFIPTKWRKRAENKKQGSSDEEVKLGFVRVIPHNSEAYSTDVYQNALNTCYDAYVSMLKSGVAPEQARMVLPQSMYTSYYVTGSLAAWARAYKLRSDKNSQAEISELAEMWSDIIKPLFPHSWEALTNATQRPN